MTHPSFDTTDLRRQFDHDWQRPRYHYLPPANWMNDPNGVIHWQGQYHLFYQYNPNGAFHADMHWGHAVSEDLIHWADLPVALAPDEPYDESGVFSGCAVNNDGVPTIIYTGTQGERSSVQTQCIATSSDGLLTWEKYADNPVIRDVPPESRQNRDFRDPFVWREGDMWYMALGSRIEGVGGTVFLYRSPDLVHWDYLNPLFTGDIATNGVIWECPNFFRLGDQWVLIVSSHLGNKTGIVLYFVGDYADHRFTPVYEGVLDYSYLYAPLSLQDDHGRRLLWGWLREGRTVEAQKAAGWAGVQSIPRALTLNQGRLVMQPVPELEAFRGKHHHFSDIDLASEMPVNISGLALDFEIRFEGDLLDLRLACAPDGSEQTRVIYDSNRNELRVDRGQSSLLNNVDTNSEVAPHPLEAGEPLELRILLDGSVLEIIANGRTSLTSRIYPSQATSQGVRLFGEGRIFSMDIWEMNSIWSL